MHNHPQTLLADLVAEVRDRVEGGTVIDGAPPPLSHREAVRYMSHRLFLNSSRHKTQLLHESLFRLEPDVQEFAAVFRRFMANLGIPVAIDAVGTPRDLQRWYVLGLTASAVTSLPLGRSLSVTHAIGGTCLTQHCWDVFQHAGNEVATKLALPVEWGGLTTPWLWRCDVP